MLYFFLFTLTSACDLCTLCTSTECQRCTQYAQISTSSPLNCECLTGYYKYSTTICTNCPYACKQCTSVNSCSSCVEHAHYIDNTCYCDDSYYFNTTSYDCQPCPATCTICSNLTSCDNCIENATLTNSVCKCKQGLYYNSTTLACETCKTPCKECESIDACTACYDNASVLNGNCTCNEGFFEGESNSCVQCPSTCKSCKSNTKCEECLMSNSYPDSSSSNARCICETGFYLCSDNECDKCHDTCKKCTSLVCQDCVDEYAVPDYSSVSGSCKCIDGYYLGETSCLACDSSCLRCTEDNCIKCVSNKATPYGSACKCITGYYPESNGVCKSCDASCAVCNSTDCLECYNEFSQIEGKFCRCPSGMFTRNLHRTCQYCPDNCDKCTSLDNCSKCKDSLAKPIKGICHCGSGYFMVSNTCVTCDSSCKSCDLDSNCLNCLDPNSQITYSKSSCECKAGFYYNTECLPCDITCNTCSISACNECKYPNSTVFGTKCECNDGFFLSSSGCESCDNKCLTCNKTSCITCIQSSVLENGKCECGLNSKYIEGKCECIEGFTWTDSCKPCQRYVSEYDLEGFFYTENFTIEIKFFVGVNFKQGIVCDDVIQKKSLELLGTEPNCYWESEKKLVIVLGKLPEFNDTSVYLNPRQFISDECECQVSAHPELPASINMIENESKLAYTASSIIGPDKVSRSCSSSVAYSCITFQGSKNIKNLIWSSDPKTPLKALNSTAVFNLSSIYSDNIKIKITQESYIGSDTEYYFTTQIVDKQILQIEIRNGKFIRTRSWAYLLIIADIVNNCGSIGEENWLWGQNLKYSEEIIEFDAKSNLLEITPHSLKCGLNYSFFVNVTKGQAFGETTFYVYPQCDDLVIVMSRGSGSISALATSTIDAGESYDPDNESLKFAWKVSNYTGKIQSTSSSIQLNPDNFSVHSIISVTLTINTSQKSKSNTIYLIPVNLNLEVVYWDSTQKTNIPATFSVNFNEVVNCKFVWKDSNSQIVSKTSMFDINFLIRQHTYQFSLSCNSSVYSSYISVNPNLPAECLEFSLSSYNISAYTEDVVVSAFHCFDGDESDYPLKYNYGIFNKEINIDLATNSYSSVHNLTLFPGLFKVRFKVCDSLEMCTEYISKQITVNKGDKITRDTVYNKLKKNVNEAIIVTGYDGSLDDLLVKTMWKDLNEGKGRVKDKFDLHSYLSAILVLAKSLPFDFDGFIETLSNLTKVFDNKSLDLLCEIQNQLIKSGADFDQIFTLNNFIVKALKTGKSGLKIKEKSQKKLNKLGYYKSVYTETPILPDYISNVPSPTNNEIVNLQLIQYQDPPGLSILFTTTGTYVNGKYNLHDEQEIFYDDVEIFVAFEVSNSTESLCIYKNDTGEYENDGCSINSTNSTHTVLKLTHTSFFFLMFLSSTQSTSSCSKSYFPVYILNFLLILCPFLLIFFKLIKKEENNNEEQIELKSEERNEEHKESSALPITTIIDDHLELRVSIFYYHLYLGMYLNGKSYLSSLKIFTILCSQVSSLFFIGLLLNQFRDVQESEGELSTLKNLTFACVAFGLGLPLQVILAYLFSKPRGEKGYLMALGFALGIGFLIVASLYIVLFNYSQCSEWSKLWSYLYCFTALLDFTFHSVSMFVLYAAKSSSTQVNIT